MRITHYPIEYISYYTLITNYENIISHIKIRMLIITFLFYTLEDLQKHKKFFKFYKMPI